MNLTELKKQLKKGEDSFFQFKSKFTSIDNLSTEITAFANRRGGKILVGINDQGDIVGLNQKEIHKLNQWISNSTSQKIEPPLYVQTKVLEVDNKLVLVISVPQGNSKPYSVNKSQFWVKNGADKRRATREELFRLMQSSGSLFADEMKTDIGIQQFDFLYFSEFYKRIYEEDIDNLMLERIVLLENLKLVKEDRLTLAGVLLFGKSNETLKPQFGIKATCYLNEDEFRDKEDIGGKLFDQHRKGIDFILRNLHRTQESGDFNSPGELEIPAAVIKEAVANAMVHRDYFFNTPVFINVYPEKVDVISPGTLPNTVTIESVKLGIHMERNPILLSFMSKIPEMGYTGRGSGIPRMIRLCRQRGVPLELENDTQREQFRVTFTRKTQSA